MEDFDIETPVLPLAEGLQIKQMVDSGNVEFEVIPDEYEDEEVHGTSAESCFDFEKLEQQVNLDMIDINDDSDDSKDASPFDKYRRKMHNLTEDGKVLKFVVQQGSGSQVPENSIVYLRYQGFQEFQELPFDSTLMQCDASRDEAVKFNLAQGGLIPGLHLGVLSMRKGEKAEFLIHPDLAYGPLGCRPRIFPNVTVLFVVEVERFIDCTDLYVNEEDLDMEERKQFARVIKAVKVHNQVAKDLFQKGSIHQAVNKYKLGINMLHNARLASEEEEKERNKTLIKFYCNSCVCHHKLKNFKRVCISVSEAMKVDQNETLNNGKMMFFWGYAKMMLCDYNSASVHLRRAIRLTPKDLEVQNALALLEKKQEDAKKEEKLMYQRAFNFKPTPTAKITEIDEEEEELRRYIKDQLMEFIDNPERDSLLLKEHYTRREEEVWVQTAKSLGLYARAVDCNPRIIDIKKPK